MMTKGLALNFQDTLDTQYLFSSAINGILERTAKSSAFETGPHQTPIPIENLLTNHLENEYNSDDLEYESELECDDIVKFSDTLHY
ncbi:hypothetical protein A3Q56_06058 [Intoshia linei]|uniref:Uncharacterized protein n=1 Tax=Intoshia linei TaxID=1819745 RepID=A0A177AXJ5_9BILA|nr:hypothetical protein A3Q56_06058 [Intoshia linei]